MSRTSLNRGGSIATAVAAVLGVIAAMFSITPAYAIGENLAVLTGVCDRDAATREYVLTYTLMGDPAAIGQTATVVATVPVTDLIGKSVTEDEMVRTYRRFTAPGEDNLRVDVVWSNGEEQTLRRSVVYDESSCPLPEATDTDGDGVPDDQDAFPNNPNESQDSDGDGTGDNSDAFPNNPDESSDSDGDGVGDNADDCDNEPGPVSNNGCPEPTDTDGDGVPDDQDAFPNNPNESQDSDGDGTGDNSDAFPNNPDESSDSDGDGVGDNADDCDNEPGPVSNNGCPEDEPTEAPNTYMASASSCDDLSSPEPIGEIVVRFTNTDDETDQSVELSVRLENEFYGSGDSQSLGSVEDGDTSNTVTLQGAAVGVNTVQFLDADGNVVHEEVVFVDACEMPEPEVGELTVQAKCGFVLVTNGEDADAEFLYGSFDNVEPDGQVTVPAGKTVKVKTSRHKLDYLAFFANGNFAEGENVRVKQNCGGDNPNGPDKPDNPNPPNKPDTPSDKPDSSGPPSWRPPADKPNYVTPTGVPSTGGEAPATPVWPYGLALFGALGLAVMVARRRVIY